MRKIIHLVRTRKKLAALGIILVAALGFFYLRAKPEPAGELITVSRGTITQVVNVTGKTKPAQDAALAFEKSGRVSRVAVKVGDRVHAGELIAELDTKELAAQLREAEASTAVQRAKLDELTRGTRQEDIQIKQTELKKAEQDLANQYASVEDVVNDAYVKADDAVRKQVDDIFINDEEPNPQLAFTVTNSQTENDVEFYRLLVANELKTWKTELGQINAKTPAADLDRHLAQAQKRLGVARDFLNKTMDAVLSASNLAQSAIATHKANITTARTNVNTALSSVNTQIQSIASESIAVGKIGDELQLKLAGTAPEQIAAQRAAVEQAEASAAIIRVQMAKSAIYSPIAGIVTKIDIEPGETASQNAAVISVISDDRLEIEANIPEIDVGKVAVGNPVRVTIDAFPGETFHGTVAYIDPAETIVDGVVNFKTTVVFAAPDPRIKSGLTTNLAIETLRKENALVVPQFGLLENDKGTFVRVPDDQRTKDIPVRIGIRGEDGEVEILEGVSAGDRILNIGVKTN